MFLAWGTGHVACEFPSSPLNENWEKVVNTSNLLIGMCNQAEEKSRMPVTNDKQDTETGYHIISPLVWLIGLSNEAKVEIKGMEMMTLVALGPPFNSGVLFIIWVKNSSSEGFATSQGKSGCFDTWYHTRDTVKPTLLYQVYSKIKRMHYS